MGDNLFIKGLKLFKNDYKLITKFRSLSGIIPGKKTLTVVFLINNCKIFHYLLQSIHLRILLFNFRHRRPGTRVSSGTYSYRPHATKFGGILRRKKKGTYRTKS